MKNYLEETLITNKTSQINPAQYMLPFQNPDKTWVTHM